MMNGSPQPSLHSDIAYTVGRIEGRLDHIEHRLSKVEQVQTSPPSPALTFRDVAPYIWGALILLAAATGRITWGQALGLLGSGG